MKTLYDIMKPNTFYTVLNPDGDISQSVKIHSGTIMLEAYGKLSKEDQKNYDQLAVLPFELGLTKLYELKEVPVSGEWQSPL